MDINCDIILGKILFICGLQFKTWRVRGGKAVQLSRGQWDHEIDLFYFDSKFGGGDQKIEESREMAKCKLSLVKCYQFG